MMKQVKFKIPVRVIVLLCGLFLSVGAFAQQITVNGHVKDATGEPIIGATVRIAGQDGGTILLYRLPDNEHQCVGLCRCDTGRGLQNTE